MNFLLLQQYLLKGLLFIRPYPLSMIWFLILSSIDAFLQDLLARFIVSSLGVLLILGLSKPKSIKRSKFEIFMQEFALLALNKLLIALLIFEIENDQPKQLSIKIFWLFYGECLFIDIFGSLMAKILSIIFFTLIILIKFEINSYHFVIFFSSSFLVIAKLTLNGKLIPYLEENNSKITSSTDVIVEVGQDLEINSKNDAFNDFLKEKGMKKQNFVDLMRKKSLQVLQEYPIYPDNKKILIDITKTDNKEITKIPFDRYLASISSKKEGNFFSISEIELFDETKELLFIW
jgi:hypothetical protein